jgi:hypothetical protein
MRVTSSRARLAPNGESSSRLRPRSASSSLRSDASADSYGQRGLAHRLDAAGAAPSSSSRNGSPTDTDGGCSAIAVRSRLGPAPIRRCARRSPRSTGTQSRRDAARRWRASRSACAARADTAITDSPGTTQVNSPNRSARGSGGGIPPRRESASSSRDSGSSGEPGSHKRQNTGGCPRCERGRESPTIAPSMAATGSTTGRRIIVGCSRKGNR